MAIKLSSTKSNLSAEQQGEWIKIEGPGAPNLPGVELLVRSVNYEPFAKARDEATRKFVTRYQGKQAPDEEGAKVNGDLYADHLLLDWRGFDETYSKDLARDCLTDLAYRDLREAVVWASFRVGRAQVEFIELSAKNSAAPSAGA